MAKGPALAFQEEAANACLQSEVEIEPDSWQALLRASAKLAESILPGKQVTIRIVDSATQLQLNRGFRGVPATTDVLSFEGELDYAGDISLDWAVCAQQARANANSHMTEAVALIAHGMLHLAGFDHQNDADEQAMSLELLRQCAKLGYHPLKLGH